MGVGLDSSESVSCSYDWIRRLDFEGYRVERGKRSGEMEASSRIV